MRLGCILPALFILLFQAPRAQMPDYHVRLLNEKNGIRNYGVRALLKDQKDFLWIMYGDRVQRFDGKFNREFRFGQIMISMFCDEHNRIWASSTKQVFRMENEFDGFKPVPIDTSPENTIGTVCQLPDRQILLQTNKGFFRYNSGSNCFEAITNNILSGFRKINITRFAQYESSIFFQNQDTIYLFNNKTNSLKQLPGPSIYTMDAVNDHTLLLSTWTYSTFWYDYQSGKISRIRVDKYFPNEKDTFLNMRYMTPVKDGKFIVTSQKGLLEYDSKADRFRKLDVYFEGHPLEVEFASGFCRDRNGTIWISYEGGIIYFNCRKSQIGLIRNSSENTGKQSWNNNVRKIVEDEHGNLWFVTINGFAHWDLTTGKIESLPSEQEIARYSIYPSIRGLAYDGKCVILGPTNFGLWLYRVRDGMFFRPLFPPGPAGDKLKNKLNGDFINQIVALKNGNFLIAARFGAYILKDQDYSISELNYPGASERSVFCMQDSKGRILLQTAKNIYCLDSTYRPLFHVPSPVVFNSCLIETGDDEYLVGTNGIHRLSLHEKDTLLKPFDSFFDEKNVSLMFLDKRKRLWVGSDEGFFLDDMEAKRIQKFDYSDNMQGNGFYNQGFCLSRSGMVYVAGTFGINYFRPELIEIEKQPLLVSFLNISVNDDDSNFLRKQLPFHLKYYQNSLRFEYVAPYYKNTYGLTYRYYLEGLDKSWRSNGSNNMVVYSSLPAGNYVFHVMASYNGQDWSKEQRFEFEILPPFWQTWWFYCLVVLIISGLLYAFYRYRIRQVLQLHMVRNRISAELHDDIGSRLTNINILASLTKHTMNEPKQASTHLQRIAEEVQTSAEALDDIVWSINTTQDSLEQVIARMRRYVTEVLSGQQVFFSTDLPEKVYHMKFPMEKRHDVYLLFKEIINNIHKHALSSQVTIAIKINQSIFSMNISDNGRGFNLYQSSNGNGLENLKQRAEKWNGKMVIISDEGRGTDISIRIPV